MPPRRSARGHGASERSLSYLLLLLAQQVYKLEHKPPVTILLVIVQALFFLQPEGFEWVPSVRAGCMLPKSVFGGQWGRLFWSPFLHGDNMHLYFNMSSLLWKGSQLEPQLGTLAFARLVAELAFVGNFLYLAAAALLAQQLPALGFPLMRTCCVGFSGVLFGMKVVLNSRTPGWSQIYGVPLPTKYACWGELVVAQLMVPQASFTGHLCGILAGLLYVYCTSRLPFLPGSNININNSSSSSSSGRYNTRSSSSNRDGTGFGSTSPSAARGGASMLWRLLVSGGGASAARTYGRGTWGSGGDTAAGTAGGTARPQVSRRSGGRSGGSRRQASQGLRLAAAACSVLAVVVLAALAIGNPGKPSLERFLLEQGQGQGQFGGLDWLQQGPSHRSQPLAWLGAQLGARLAPASWQLPPIRYRSLLLASVAEVDGSWYSGSLPTGWRRLPPAAQPAAAGAAAAADAVAGAAGWAVDQAGWLGWLLRHQRGAAAAAGGYLQASLLHVPPGTLALSGAMCAVALLWRVLPPAVVVSLLELPSPHSTSAGGSSGSGSKTSRPGWRQQGRQAVALLVAGLSHESLAHLLLSLATLGTAGGALERDLSQALCHLSCAGCTLSQRSCKAVAATAFVAAFWVLSAALYGAARLLVPRVRWLQRRCPPLLGWKGADAACSTLLLVLLAAEARQQLQAVAAATGSSAAAALAGSLAAAVLRRLPKPMLRQGAGAAARGLQLLAAAGGRFWSQQAKTHGPAPPSAVLLVAARVVAEQLLMVPGVQAASTSRQQAGSSRGQGDGKQPDSSPFGAALPAPLQLAMVLGRALLSVLTRAAVPVPVPAGPLGLRLLRGTSRRRLALCCAAALVAGCQALLLLVSRTTLGALNATLPFAACQLLLTACCLPLLAASAAMRWPPMNAPQRGA
ncbi:hypothetical protein D9Q98_009898 [Chlorella vulgaris]|uniref:Peptidase S54 rhomboid domain-containing protein n=1 Tax=Chlorella vulgaris TaxID=3077 RepID=A0A9D4YSX1_CHLVU|nr:hypothetical protein D9Q98_009898 [Chlorella vulgaris]